MIMNEMIRRRFNSAIKKLPVDVRKEGEERYRVCTDNIDAIIENILGTSYGWDTWLHCDIEEKTVYCSMQTQNTSPHPENNEYVCRFSYMDIDDEQREELESDSDFREEIQERIEVAIFEPLIEVYNAMVPEWE